MKKKAGKTEMITLKGVRFVRCTETAKDMRLDVSKLKQLTGDEIFIGRPCHTYKEV